MSKDTKAIIGTIVGTGLVVAGLLSAQLSSGLAGLNTRIDGLSASANARFDDVHGRIDDVVANVNARFSDLNARFDDLREDIRELRALVIEALKRTEPAD